MVVVGIRNSSHMFFPWHGRLGRSISLKVPRTLPGTLKTRARTLAAPRNLVIGTRLPLEFDLLPRCTSCGRPVIWTLVRWQNKRRVIPLSCYAAELQATRPQCVSRVANMCGQQRGVGVAKARVAAFGILCKQNM